MTKKETLEYKTFQHDVVAQYDSLYAFALSKARNADQAADMVQSTMVKAFDKWRQFKPGTNLKAWLFTIMRNDFFSDLRKSHRTTELTDVHLETIPEPEADQEDHEIAIQEFCAIAPALAQIPVEQRDAIVAVHYVGMSYEACARILEVEIGTVKSRISRGLDAIRMAMQQGQELEYDLSPWANLPHDVPITDPYFPIAHAYGTLYAQFLERPEYAGMETHRKASPKVKSDVDRIWENFATLDLGDDAPFDQMIR